MPEIPIFEPMNFIDIVIALPLLWGLYKGFRKGFIVELASLIGFWAGIWGSIHFSDRLVPVLRKCFDTSPSWLPALAFLILFLLILVLIYLIAKLIQKAVESMALGLVNKLAGALFGFLKYLLVLSVLIYVLNPYFSSPQKKESILYTNIEKIAPRIIPQLKELKRGSLDLGREESGTPNP